MTLSEVLDLNISKGKEPYQYWIKEAVNHSAVLEEIMEYAFGGTEKQCKRANWILHHASDARSEVFYPYLQELVKNLLKAQTEAEKRFILRYFSKYKLPDESQLGNLLDYCFNSINSPDSKSSAPAIYSISILGRIASIYPEIRQEILASLSEGEHWHSPGMKVRAKRVIKELDQF
jgi:hypothetical protein